MSLSWLRSVIRGAFLPLYRSGDHIALDTSITDKIRELPPILNTAQRSVRIATDFDSTFFDNDEIKGAFQRILDRGVEVKLLTEKYPVDWYQNKPQIAIRQVQKLPCHIMVIDDYIRLESPHHGRQFGSFSGDAALIFKAFPRTAKRYRQVFENLWEKALVKT